MMVSVLKKEKVLPALTLTCLLIATLSVSVVPTKASTLQPHQPILINGNNGFTSANGVVQGSGSLQDPYLISGWDINSSSSNGIAVGNTTANFAIRNVNVHSKTAAFIGVSIDHARYAALENSTIHGNSLGVWVNFSNNTVIDDNDVSSNNAGGIGFNQVSYNVTITRNLASGENGGIGLSGSHNATVANNVANNDQWGITYGSCQFGCSPGIIKDNQLSMDTHGVFIASASAIVENNTFTNTMVGANLYSGTGVDLYTAFGTLVSDNVFRDNPMAILFDYQSQGNRIVGNDISGGFVGVYSQQNSCCSNITGNVFRTTQEGGVSFQNGHGVLSYWVYGNAFVGNGTLAYDDTGANSWNAPYPAGGNYWISYTGVDNCSGPAQNVCPSSDGIGDTPFTLTGGARDLLPLMVPADSAPPSWVSGSTLTVSGKGSTFVTLSWPLASDDTVVVFYKVYENGTLLATLPGSSSNYNATGLNPNSNYSFNVVAVDAAQHPSASELSTTVRTNQASNPSSGTMPPISPYWYVLLMVAGVAIISSIYYVNLSKRKNHNLTQCQGKSKL